jgi:hypothetical protein
VTVPDSRARALRARLQAMPVMGGLLPVHRSEVAADVLAGITLAAVSIPVSLGYAKIAGMPVVTGLYTLLLPMGIFAILGSSRHLAVGADSATAAILAAALAGLAVAGSPRYVGLAGLAALLTGGLLLLARLARLGFLANFLSRTVLVGFLVRDPVYKMVHKTGCRSRGWFPFFQHARSAHDSLSVHLVAVGPPVRQAKARPHGPTSSVYRVPSCEITAPTSVTPAR